MMKNYLKNAFFSLSDSFGQVRGNARIVVLIQPVWAVTYNLYGPYLSLYMSKLGCTYEQIGVINAAGMLFGAVVALFAGWLTDRLGRRRTCFFADMTCWAFACALWGLSGGFLGFLAAYLANAFVRLVTVGWNCMLTEGTAPENRLNVFWWINIAGTLATFATPLTGLLIAPLGLVAAMRWVLLCSAVMLAVSFTIRHLLFRETPIGLARMAATRHDSPLAALKAYPPLFRLLRRNPLLLIFIALRMLYYVQVGLRGTYLPITVVGGLGFPDEMIGTIGLITGAVMLLAQFLLLPRMRTLPRHMTLYFSYAALIASSAMLALAPAGNLPVLIASTVLTAAGALPAALIVDTAAANAMPDEHRAPLVAFTTVLIVLLSAPSMWLGGVLAGLPGLGPRLPMALIGLMFFVSIGLAMLAGRIENKKMSEPRRESAAARF